jgi:hypothetical protein
VADQKTDDAGARSHRLSRRRLLAGGALASASLPALHELIPHNGLHHALGGDQQASASVPDAGPHAGHGSSGGQMHAAFTDGPEVDHAANGFDPTELLRDFDYGETRRLPGGQTLREWTVVAAEKEIEVAPGVKYLAWT